MLLKDKDVSNSRHWNPNPELVVPSGFSIEPSDGRDLLQIACLSDHVDMMHIYLNVTPIKLPKDGTSFGPFICAVYKNGV